MSNLIQDIDGAEITFSDSAIATEIGTPLFFWGGQLVNVAIVFFPVVFFISMFWFIYGSGKSLLNKSSLNNKKDLYNK